MAVPTTYLNSEVFNNGKASLDEILNKISHEEVDLKLEEKPVFDSLVIGGGPGGATAAIYGARKGIKVGLVAEEPCLPLVLARILGLGLPLQGWQDQLQLLYQSYLHQLLLPFCP